MTFEQTMTLCGTILALLVFTVPWITRLTTAITTLNLTIADLGRRLDDHETRLEKLEDRK